MTTYELWQDAEGDLTFIPSEYTQKDMVMKNAKIIWTCEAPDWETAMSLKDEHLGFKKPV